MEMINSCSKCGARLPSEDAIHCTECKGKTTVEFLSKHPHTTYWIHVVYPVDKYPTVLVSKLKQAGFTPHEIPPPPPLDGIAELDLCKSGSDLFAGWTPKEKRNNVRDARKMMRTTGFTNVNHRRLRAIDLL